MSKRFCIGTIFGVCVHIGMIRCMSNSPLLSGYFPPTKSHEFSFVTTAPMKLSLVWSRSNKAREDVIYYVYDLPSHASYWIVSFIDCAGRKSKKNISA